MDLFAFPNEGIYNPGRKSFEGVIGGTFSKVPPKNRVPKNRVPKKLRSENRVFKFCGFEITL